jgi:hypothetical protein
MIEIELTREQVDFLFPVLKKAESSYTNDGEWVACKKLTKLYNELYKQIFTYGQATEKK